MNTRLILKLAVATVCVIGCKKERHDIDLNEGLIAYYPFNGNTKDESGNNNHGTAFGGNLVNDRNGKPNKAFHFDGDDYIQVKNSTSLSSLGDSFSISAWIYNEGPGISLVCKSPFNGSSMQFRFYSETAIFFANNGKAGDFSSSLATVKTWKHIVVTSDGKEASFYLNGEFQSKVELHADESAGDHTSDMFIGVDTHGANEFYNGTLDEIRIYNKVLNSAQIMCLAILSL